MSELSLSAEKHLSQLSALQSLLSASSGAAILEHNYCLLLMGSFTVVVGTAHRRLRFAWDGREYFLNVEQCTCTSQSSPQEWTQSDNIGIRPPKSVWPVIQEKCRLAFSA